LEETWEKTMREPMKFNIETLLDTKNCMALHADFYAVQLSYPIFPVSPKAGNKKPMIEGGFKAASRDERQVSKWWELYRGALVGLPTGSVSGVFVLDVDIKHEIDGLAELHSLEERHEALPHTFTVQTPSGGYHLYFKMPQNVHIPCSASKIAPNLDIRANGGYVVAAGSINEELQEYVVIDDHPLAELPSWLQELAQNSQVTNNQIFKNGEVIQGQRNNNLTRILGSLRAFGMETYDLLQIGLEINKNCCRPPLSEKEVSDICRSVGKMNRSYSFNQLGNSERFIDRYADHFKCLNRKDWYYWEEGVWKLDTRSRAYEMAKQIALDLKSEADALAKGETYNG
jgi:putative DNA primase/helicase